MFVKIAAPDLAKKVFKKGDNGYLSALFRSLSTAKKPDGNAHIRAFSSGLIIHFPGQMAKAFWFSRLSCEQLPEGGRSAVPYRRR